MNAIRHNRDISGAWMIFIPNKSEGFTQAGVERLNDGWLWSRRWGAPCSSASDSKDESAYRHADCCKDARDLYPLFAEES